MIALIVGLIIGFVIGVSATLFCIIYKCAVVSDKESRFIK